MLLKDNIYYVGVNDRHKDLFEGLWPLPYGVSYNSYIITDEKVALIDTVDVAFFPDFLRSIRSVIGERGIDYLIINHMEPDHSGAINLIRQYYPEIIVVGNRQTLGMVEGYYGNTGATQLIGDGDTLSLGAHTLKFYLTPMIHWPETMMTYEELSGTLFSGDAFGCYGALNGAVCDTMGDTERFLPEMRRYYSNIVGKYGAPVQKALAKLGGVDLKMLCPTHGPVWTERIPKVLDEYKRMSTFAAEKGAVIAYASMYGHTERMAETVAEELSERGIRHISVYDLSRHHYSYVLADIYRFKALIIGSPTYNGHLFPPVEKLLREVANRNVEKRCVSYFGSFTWACAVDREMGKWFDTSKLEMVGTPVVNKQGIETSTLDACRTLADDVADRLDKEFSE